MWPTNYSLTNHILCMCKQDLRLNNPRGLICHKAKPNWTIIVQSYLNFFNDFFHLNRVIRYSVSSLESLTNPFKYWQRVSSIRSVLTDCTIIMFTSYSISLIRSLLTVCLTALSSPNKYSHKSVHLWQNASHPHSVPTVS